MRSVTVLKATLHRAALRIFLRSLAAAMITLSLVAMGRVPAAAQVLPLSADLHVQHMFSRAEAGYVEDEIKLARAFQTGTGVERDPASDRMALSG